MFDSRGPIFLVLLSGPRSDMCIFALLRKMPNMRGGASRCRRVANRFEALGSAMTKCDIGRQFGSVAPCRLRDFYRPRTVPQEVSGTRREFPGEATPEKI